MSLPKRVGVVLLATLIVVVELALAYYIFGIRSIIGAFLFNFLPLGWVPVVKRVLAVRLLDWCYRLSGWETRSRVYERLGVPLFRRLMLLPIFRILNREIPREFRRRNYAAAERQMRLAETSHMLTLLFVLVVTAFALANRWWDAGACLIAWSIPVNVYPVLLQRYNRARILRVTERAAAASGRRQEQEVANINTNDAEAI